MGKISLNEKKNQIDIEYLLKNGVKRIHDLGISPSGIELIDDQIVLANLFDKCLTIYDKEFKLIKRIDEINGEDFEPMGIASNSKDRIIYICDFSNLRITMTDFDFNFIKSVSSFAAENNEFSFSSDICYKSDTLYICDYLNSQIQVYSKDLDFLKSTKLDYKPWKIKASNSIICVMSSASSRGIYFYNLKDFSFIRSYEHGKGRISQIDSSFCEFNHETKIFYCFDENGILKEEITLTGTDNLLTNISDGTFIRMDECILLISNSQKKIIKFSNK